METITYTQEGNTSSNHPFSGAMLDFWGVPNPRYLVAKSSNLLNGVHWDSVP